MLDDYLGVSQELADWSLLKGLCQVDVFRHALPELDQAAQALAPYDVLCTGKAHRTMDLTAVTERGIAVPNVSIHLKASNATPENKALSSDLGCSRTKCSSRTRLSP